MSAASLDKRGIAELARKLSEACRNAGDAIYVLKAVALSLAVNVEGVNQDGESDGSAAGSILLSTVVLCAVECDVACDDLLGEVREGYDLIAARSARRATGVLS